MTDHCIALALNVAGALSLFGAAMAFAGNAVSNMVVFDWYTSENHTPTKLNRFMGYFFGIKSYGDVLRFYTGGTYEEMKRHLDVNAPTRGVVWTLVGTAFVITALFL